MATLFYDHLVDWQKIHDALAEVNIDDAERLEALEHSEEILHTEILIVVISHLPQHKHDEFLELFHQAPHDQNHLIYLRMNGSGDIETAIRQRSNEVIEEILAEIYD